MGEKEKPRGRLGWLPYAAVGLGVMAAVHVFTTRSPSGAAPRADSYQQQRESSGLASLAEELAAAKKEAAAAPPPATKEAAAARPKAAKQPWFSSSATKKGAAGEASKRTQLEPMWGLKPVRTNDVIMALGFGYQRREFARFVSTLRRTGYDGDIALATEPEERMRRGVAEYLQSQRVLCYGFEYSCVKKNKKKGRRLLGTPGGCRLDNWYSDGDARGPRPLALARYEMYRSWLLNYDSTVWGIIFDFRDTFFQANPLARVDRSKSAPNLHLFAENRDVKTVGKCVFNSGWLRCWGKQTPKLYANNSVVCSGSTLGSRDALMAYSERMLEEFDKMQCHTTPAATQSDQGYHNYLYHSGVFANLPGVRVVHHEQGHGGMVNTIGAMNGFRVPKHMKGPLDTHWKIRDADGYLIEYDGTRSAAVHQWDRFHKELVKFIDSLVNEYEHRRPNDKS